MSRRTLLQGALALAAMPLPLLAAPVPKRIYMILYRGETEVEQGFRAHFRDQGVAAEFIVRDVALDVRKVPALIREARALKADLIYTWGTTVSIAVAGSKGKINPAEHVTDIPVVFTMVSSPEAAGLADARGWSGRNITGTSHLVPTLQQLGAIRAFRPFTRLGVIYNPAESNSLFTVRELRAAAVPGRFTLVERPVPLDQQGQPIAAALPDMVAHMARERVDFLYMGPDSFLAANRKVFTEAAVAGRLPMFAATESALRDGKALFGLVSGYDNVGRLTAHKALQILQHGRSPAAVRVETLARFSYLVNMQVAAALSFYPSLKVINYAELMR